MITHVVYFVKYFANQYKNEAIITISKIITSCWRFTGLIHGYCNFAYIYVFMYLYMYV